MKEYMMKVNEDVETYIVTSKDDNDVVVMSKNAYESLSETVYLLQSPKNAKRLLESIEELEAGGGIEKPLLEEEE